jgi:hypothetical protein
MSQNDIVELAIHDLEIYSQKLLNHKFENGKEILCAYQYVS